MNNLPSPAVQVEPDQSRCEATAIADEEGILAALLRDVDVLTGLLCESLGDGGSSAFTG